MASLLLTGNGIPKDEKKALELFGEAGYDGHAEACYQASICCKRGIAPKGGLWTEVFWLKKATELNHTKAKVVLAGLYLSGKADPLHIKRPEKAFKLLKENAELPEPDEEGLYELGRYYLEGIGTAVDYKQAYIAFSEAHDRGHPLAKKGMDDAVRAEKRTKRKGWFF